MAFRPFLQICQIIILHVKYVEWNALCAFQTTQKFRFQLAVNKKVVREFHVSKVTNYHLPISERTKTIDKLAPNSPVSWWRHEHDFLFRSTFRIVRLGWIELLRKSCFCNCRTWNTENVFEFNVKYDSNKLFNYFYLLR